MSVERVANIRASEYVTERKPFRGSNLFARHIGQAYVVFSYGMHWPLYAYRDGVWYENMERYSVTTSKHRRQARPAGVETVLKNVTSMKAIYGNHGWGWAGVQS